MNALTWIIVALLTLRECLIIAADYFPPMELLLVFNWGVTVFLLVDNNLEFHPSRTRLFLNLSVAAAIIAGIFNPVLLPVLGLMLINYRQYKDFAILLLLLFVPIFNPLSFFLCLDFLVYLTVVCYLSYLDFNYRKEKREKLQRVDDFTSRLVRLELDHRRLLDEQEQGREADVLAERNRIAREIHDNVGHRLTAAILQLTAWQMANPSAHTSMLAQVTDNLQEAMDDVRKSVHNLHEEALDIEISLINLSRNYTFCPVYINVDIDNPLSSAVYHAFMSISREALANTAKHSNATRVDINLREAATQYQLLITDNGSPQPKQKEGSEYKTSGIGLYNMEDRVSRLGGEIHITQQKGFRIFIKIPIKEAS